MPLCAHQPAGRWTHSIHQLSPHSAEASTQVAWPSVSCRVQKACSQPSLDGLHARLRIHSIHQPSQQLRKASAQAVARFETPGSGSRSPFKGRLLSRCAAVSLVSPIPCRRRTPWVRQVSIPLPVGVPTQICSCSAPRFLAAGLGAHQPQCSRRPLRHRLKNLLRESRVGLHELKGLAMAKAQSASRFLANERHQSLGLCAEKGMHVSELTRRDHGIDFE